ncbi:MAG: energy coupling factor transporter S component ThiW [Promethearchaeota archaeon]|nr:MAG: energy coupling factor transporter S component ThiW [Candidatus Lokiarchaeota archaeon]
MFDQRLILALIISLNGLFTLFISFNFDLFQQQLVFLFTLGVANAIIFGLSALFLLDKKKNLISSFVGGTFFILEVAFTMIIGTFRDLYILAGIVNGTSTLFFIISALISAYKKKNGGLSFQIEFGLVGNTILSSVSGIAFARSVNGHSLWFLLLLLSGAICMLLAIVYFQKERDREYNLALRVAMAAMFTALGVVLSYINPFAYIVLGGFKINPFAHLINSIVGVFLGPLWGVIVACFIAIIRYSAGIGTVFAFPGGIPGALVVGIIAVVLSAMKKEKYRSFAALTEVIGTVGIGAVICYAFMGAASTIYLWGGFAMSSLLGSTVGFVIIRILKKQNIDSSSFGDSILV